MKLSILGLAIPAVIAPAFTMSLSVLLLWAFDTLPEIFSMAADTRQAFGYTSSGDHLWSSIGRLLYDFFFGPFVSVPFGFIGAAIFLAPTLALASLRGGIQNYMVAGGLSGAAHAACGLMLAPLLSESYDWLALALGFLPYEMREIAITTAVSAPLAGVLAGYVYGRRVRKRSAGSLRSEPK